jgi:hypothetical protein
MLCMMMYEQRRSVRVMKFSLAEVKAAAGIAEWGKAAKVDLL